MDAISNMIIKIKNANIRGLSTVTFPMSKVIFSIAKLLEKEGYLTGVTLKGKGVIRSIEAILVYDEKKQPKVIGVKRISKLSRRLYTGAAEIRTGKKGLGLRVLSTPKGVMADRDAKAEKVGGEILFKIW